MFGEKITQLRKARGLSCYALAKRSGHPVSSIYGIETGANKNPRFEIICDIADVLEISMEELKKEFQKCEKDKKMKGQ